MSNVSIKQIRNLEPTLDSKLNRTENFLYVGNDPDTENMNENTLVITPEELIDAAFAFKENGSQFFVEKEISVSPEEAAIIGNVNYLVKVSSAVDLNNIMKVGVYYFEGEEGAAVAADSFQNIPSNITTSFNLKVYPFRINLLEQVLTTVENVSYRRVYNGSSWTAWAKDYTSLDTDIAKFNGDGYLALPSGIEIK